MGESRRDGQGRRGGSRALRGLLAGLTALLLTAGWDVAMVGQGQPTPAQGTPQGQTPPPAQGTPQGQTPPPAQGTPREGDAQTPAQGEAQTPTFRAGIDFVRVDVIVTDKQGNPITDLTEADFELLEDDKPQKVETFKMVRVTGAPAPDSEPAREIRNEFDEETEAQRDDVRIFVFMLDDYHVRLGSSMGVREPLIEFIRTQLGPLDMIGVMYPLTPISAMTLTRNHEAVIRTIQRFEGRKYDYRPRNQMEEQYSMYPAEVVERIRNEVTFSALRGLAVRLGGLREGRKAIILVSEGFSNYLPPQLRDPVASMPGFGNSARRNPLAGEGSLSEERAQLFSEVEMQTYLREVYDAANRNNTAIYALDPRGLAVFEFGMDQPVGPGLDRSVLDSSMDTLRTLARETDGRAIVNRNDLEGGLRQVVRDSSAYYLLGYTTSAPSDGKFHEIKVRVKRPGVQVRARRGYWALTAEESESVTASRPEVDPAVTNALAVVEGRHRARSVRTWLGVAPAENGRTRVSLVWEPVPPVPGSRTETTPAALSVMAAGRDEPYFRGRVGVGELVTANGATTPSATAKGGRLEFEADPGPLDLRYSVVGRGGESIDSDFIDANIPDFTTPQVHLSTPAVVRARNALEVRTLNADPAAVPDVGREFRRTERLLIRFAARAPGTETPTVVVRLLNRAGQPMSELPVAPLASATTGVMQVDLPLGSLAPGDYVLEIKATAGEAGEARQLVGFRVIS